MLSVSQSVTYQITSYQSVGFITRPTQRQTKKQTQLHVATHTRKQQQNIQGTRNIHQHQ